MDKISQEIIRSGLYSIAREMKVAMMRTATNPILHSGADASAAVCGPDLQLVAQGNDIPAMLGSSVFSTRAAVTAIGVENLRAGDVIISNDIYSAGGSHLPDAQFTRPVFFEGRIVAYTITRAHWTDIGGKEPTSSSAATWDIFAEGMRIPPLLLYREDTLNESLAAFIMANSRQPDIRRSDIQAQYAGCFVGERRLLELFGKFGTELVWSAMSEALDRSRALMRAAIQQIPDGVYEAEDELEAVSEGYSNGGVVPIKVKVTVEGDTITFDFTGSAPQVRGGINCPYPVTAGAVWYTVKAITDPTIPINQGCYDPITVTAPEGSVLSCVYPAAVVTGNVSTASRIIDMMLRALAPALPDRVMAESHATPCSSFFAGRDPDEKRRKTFRQDFVIAGDLNPGGFGARPTKDGISVIRAHIGNTGTQSVEYLEYSAPLHIESWNIVADTGGAGFRRGGCTAARVYRMEYDEAIMSFAGEHGLVPPKGLFGGRSGTLQTCVVERADGSTERLTSKGLPRVLHKDDRVTITAAGSGGYGDPHDREPERVLADVHDGYVTVAAAQTDYGVVLTGDGLAVDDAATIVRRGEVRERQAAA